MCSLGILNAMTPALPWERSAPQDLPQPVIAASVDVAGTVNDTVMVRIPAGDVTRLAEAIGDGAAPPAELVSEMANTLAGHLKVLIATSMATGIPTAHANDPGPLPGYRTIFRCSQVIMEVTSRG